MSDGPYNLDDYADDGSGPSRRATSKKRSGLPANVPMQGATADEFAAFLTDFARLDDDPIVAADRWGLEGSEPVELILRSGKRIRWAEQDHLFGPRLQRPFVMATGFKPRPLTQGDVQLAAWAIITFATLRAATTEADEFREFWVSYLAERSEVPADRDNERAMRELLQRWRQLADARSEDRPFVLVDLHTKERLVRRLDFAMHVRSVRRSPISWARLHGLARQCGWELDRIQFRPSRFGAPYVDAKVFVVPANWGEDA